MAHIVGQAGTKGLQISEPEKASKEKEGPSKFDQKLQNRQTENASLAPEVTQVSVEQKRMLESVLRKRLEQGNAQDVLKVDLRKGRDKLDSVAQKVNAAPKTPAMDAIRNRLTKVEAQYQKTEKL